MSSATCGVSSSSSSIFGGLCSGNSRRPSMFTAKYRLREERKKVLKMSMAKVKRIEDPESFLRRSVLINNTIKRLQREVREEKMMRHGGYSSKLSCSSFKRSYACSRLSDMHIPDDDSLMSRSHHHHVGYDNSSSLISNNNGGRKRPHDDADECDVQAVLSQIYIPPTPCIISSMDEDDCSDSPCSSSSSSSGSSVPSKKAKFDEDPTATLLTVADECSLEVDVDVDVVGDSETSDWPTPPEPQSEMIIVTPSVIDSSVNDSIAAAMDSMESLSQTSVACVADDRSGSSSNVIVDDDCEFSLDLPPTPPSPTLSLPACSAIVEEEIVVTEEDEDQARQVSSSSSSLESQVVVTEEVAAADENTCPLQQLSSACCSVPAPASLLIPSTTLDRKCSNAPAAKHTTAGIPPGNHNSFITSTDLSTMSSSISSSSSVPSASSTDNKQQQQQYSSCGHSSIFGELQSVVFHSLIASLET